MSKVLVIGCGGVAGVAISQMLPGQRSFHRAVHRKPHKEQVRCTCRKACAHHQNKNHHGTGRCRRRADSYCDLIQSYKPDLVMNIALPYQDLTIMDACLACGVNYMDTANYEPERHR